MRKIRQGDNDWADIPRTDGLPMDGVGTWVGSWAIIPAVGEAAIVSGVMALSLDNMYFQRRITPADTLACPVLPTGQNYILVTQIKNDGILFSQEISHEKISIIAQGIV